MDALKQVFEQKKEEVRMIAVCHVVWKLKKTFREFQLSSLS